MKAGGAAPSRCRCNSIFGTAIITGNSAPAPAQAPPDAPRCLRPHRQNPPAPARPRPRPHQHRHPLARMVGAVPGRIVAMIGGERSPCHRAAAAQETPPPRVEPFQRAGIARHIAAVAEKAVELHEVREGQGTRPRPVPQGQQMFEKCSIDLPLCSLPMPRIEKMSPILPTAWVARPASAPNPEASARVGRNREIPPVRRALETALGPHKGPRDHPPHLHRMQRGASARTDRSAGPARRPLHAPQSGTRCRPRYSRSASRCADARPPAVDDLGARGVAVAQYPLHPRQSADLCQQVGRKGGDRIGEIGPVPGHRHARQFPMARRRVLAARHFRRRTPAALRAAPSPGAASPEARPTAAPSPSASSTGIRSGPLRPSSARPAAQACAIWPSVLAPVSPKARRIRRAAEPTESITIRKARLMRSSHGSGAAHPAHGRPSQRPPAPP
jgi:hypothetical protein